MIRHATIFRTETGDTGTFGRLVMDDGWRCVTGELPWRDNQPGRSCIPTGTYLAELFQSPKHGPCYLLQGVPRRSDVEIHSANWMGDKAKGFRCQLLGCIALGDHVGDLIGQRAVLKSKFAVESFMARTAGDPILLTITEDFNYDV